MEEQQLTGHPPLTESYNIHPTDSSFNLWLHSKGLSSFPSFIQRRKLRCCCFFMSSGHCELKPVKVSKSEENLGHTEQTSFPKPPDHLIRILQLQFKDLLHQICPT